MCLYPRMIRNKKYEENNKNGGVIPAIFDIRVLHVAVGCGKCMECKKQKARGWQVRLMEDIKENKNGKFITLTFSNESIKELSKDMRIEGYELDNTIATIAMRRFLERWRKKYKVSVRHWMITELGGNGTENIHMHGIIWTNEDKKTIEELWKYGYIWVGDYVNEKTVNYIIKYVHKADEKHKNYDNKILCSKGIGGSYTKRYNYKINEYKGIETDESYTLNNGSKTAMPIYYRNKRYSDDEREKLWINKLDENKRYVNGVEIDISKDNKAYYKMLETAQRINNKLGYGNNESWKQKKYEEERRAIMMKERIK